MSKIERQWLSDDLNQQLTGMQYDINGLTGAVDELSKGLTGARADIAGLTGAVYSQEARI